MKAMRVQRTMAGVKKRRWCWTWQRREEGGWRREGASLQAKPMNMANRGLKGAHSYSKLSRMNTANSRKALGLRSWPHVRWHEKFILWSTCTTHTHATTLHTVYNPYKWPFTSWWTFPVIAPCDSVAVKLKGVTYLHHHKETSSTFNACGFWTKWHA